MRLLEDNINAIRSQIEIENARSDRNFQELAAVVGTGVVVAGLIGENAIAECKSIFSNEFPVCQNTLVYKLILIVIVSVLTWFVRRRILKRV